MELYFVLEMTMETSIHQLAQYKMAGFLFPPDLPDAAPQTDLCPINVIAK